MTIGNDQHRPNPGGAHSAGTAPAPAPHDTYTRELVEKPVTLAELDAWEKSWAQTAYDCRVVDTAREAVSLRGLVLEVAGALAGLVRQVEDENGDGGGDAALFHLRMTRAKSALELVPAAKLLESEQLPTRCTAWGCGKELTKDLMAICEDCLDELCDDHVILVGEGDHNSTHCALCVDPVSGGATGPDGAPMRTDLLE